MNIGIISDSDHFIPLAGALVSQRIQVYLFYSPSPDSFINQKVKAFAEQFHITITEEKERKRDIYEWIPRGKFDICFIIGYSRLIILEKIKSPSTQLYNIHFGPLPEFKGPVPVFWQLKLGVEKLGMTIHRLTRNFDEGPVVWMKEIPNLPHYNFKSVMQLFSQLCVEGAFFILQRKISRTPLTEINRKLITPSFQKRPKLNDVLIDWEKMTAEDICNLIRACNPWNKGAIVFWKKQEIKLMDARIIGNCIEPAGTIINSTDKLHIACNDGKTIEISMLIFNDSYWASYNVEKVGLKAGCKFEINSIEPKIN